MFPTSDSQYPPVYALELHRVFPNKLGDRVLRFHYTRTLVLPQYCEIPWSPRIPKCRLSATLILRRHDSWELPKAGSPGGQFVRIGCEYAQSTGASELENRVASVRILLALASIHAVVTSWVSRLGTHALASTAPLPSGGTSRRETRSAVWGGTIQHPARLRAGRLVDGMCSRSIAIAHKTAPRTVIASRGDRDDPRGRESRESREHRETAPCRSIVHQARKHSAMKPRVGRVGDERTISVPHVVPSRRGQRRSLVNLPGLELGEVHSRPLLAQRTHPRLAQLLVCQRRPHVAVNLLR